MGGGRVRAEACLLGDWEGRTLQTWSLYVHWKSRQLSSIRVHFFVKYTVSEVSSQQLVLSARTLISSTRHYYRILQQAGRAHEYVYDRRTIFKLLIDTIVCDVYIMAADEPSICIPRVSPDVTIAHVTRVFERVLGQEAVERVDVVPWRGRGPDGPRRVFIRLRAWPADETAQRMRQRLLDGKEIELVHTDPWVWRCARSRVPKPMRTDRLVGRGLAPALGAIARECAHG